ncbi:thioredoxin domain-containing protein [Chryseobacterium chendengshani]|uniref:vitamin K epoxide reductase family protein n=1 Tax=Chryseobacterium sp. LJ668 TaxID=2864040 RepID=UPI001C6930E9|nr:vitamin K epoxide reductase family protein [Chryseobacterium sp. LJ668]MBW8522225.1 thioredoxin domain-containing protein [Chryseobacterium sp. LJ668]QYK17868.1 thioredoxin domain-containing protein [Chryseobacterium sp. LJ668]
MNFDKLIDHFRLDRQEFYFQFNSHPNYPSALAFSDTLNFLGIKNDAYELDKEYWEELPDEFMALVNDSFSLVKKKGNDFTIYSDKIRNLSKKELYENSGDFVLLFEKTEHVKTTAFFNFKPFIYLIFGIVILFSLIQLTWYESLFNILSLAGVYISIELFNQKFGQESAVVSNICGGGSGNISQSACSKIFSSDKTDVLGLKLSDLSLIYFLGISFIGLLFPDAQFVLRVLALISVLVIVYSFYIQAFVEKSLCRICLVIIFILLAQITISTLFFTWGMSLAIIFVVAILFISLFITVAYLSNLLKQKEELKKSNAKNLRFKRNYDLFKRELLDKEKIEFTDKQTFFLGNRDAKLHIAVVSNPYCGFCKDAHKIVEDLLAQYPEDISAQMRFNYSGERADEKYTRLILDFLSIYQNKSQKEFLNSVDTWFKNKDESEIRRKSGTENTEDLTEITQMTAENSAAGITFTPVFIINGYQFPDKYDREDIHYFISEMIEDEDFLS